MNSQVWWFVARSSGIVAWALLTASVVWGLLLSTKVSSTRLAARKLRPAWLLDLHRHLGGLAVIFTMIHLIGLVADSYVTFGWAEILLPMASEWKPGAVAFGVVSMYLLLAIEATSLAIRRLPRQLWRWIHRSSFALFAMATYHGIAAGTDAGNGWFRIAAVLSIIVVVALTVRLVVVVRRRSAAASATSDTARATPDPLHVPVRVPMQVASPVIRAPVGVSAPVLGGIDPLPGSVVVMAMAPSNTAPPVAPDRPMSPQRPMAPDRPMASSPPPPPPPAPRLAPPPPPAERELVGVTSVSSVEDGPERGRGGT